MLQEVVMAGATVAEDHQHNCDSNKEKGDWVKSGTVFYYSLAYTPESSPDSSDGLV